MAKKKLPLVGRMLPAAARQRRRHDEFYKINPICHHHKDNTCRISVEEQMSFTGNDIKPLGESFNIGLQGGQQVIFATVRLQGQAGVRISQDHL